MSKVQGTLPIYDYATKRILGSYNLPYAKTFEGDEETHCVDFPNTPDDSNTVAVAKILSENTPINGSRRNNDWYMAAVFSAEDIRIRAYRGIKNFVDLKGTLPSFGWQGATSNPNQFNDFNGVLIEGLEKSFSTGAPNEDAPLNTSAPEIEEGSVFEGGTATADKGTWSAPDEPITYTYQWYLNGVAVLDETDVTFVAPGGSFGQDLYFVVTAHYAGYSTSAQSNTLEIQGEL